MSRKWTPEQENAINSTGGSILVSAAAGSGKTSVLVERVIKQITDLDNPIDIDKFLIVTFTKAAAQEMRNRISARLSEMISKNPQNSHLHNQQIMLKCASLGTIHSFCASIIRENFHKLGISPKFRIAEESEISIIKNQAMEKTLNDFYEFQNSVKLDEEQSEIIKKVIKKRDFQYLIFFSYLALCLPHSFSTISLQSFL